MDPEIITETDIDNRLIESGQPVEEFELATREEWLREFRDNICCIRPSWDCDCGGNTDQLPSSASRLLTTDDEEVF